MLFRSRRDGEGHVRARREGRAGHAMAAQRASSGRTRGERRGRTRPGTPRLLAFPWRLLGNSLVGGGSARVLGGMGALRRVGRARTWAGLGGCWAGARRRRRAARWVGRGNGPGEEVDAGLAWLGGVFPLLLFLFSSFYLNIALAFRFKTKHAS